MRLARYARKSLWGWNIFSLSVQDFTQDAAKISSADALINRLLKEARQYGLEHVTALGSENLAESTEADILHAGLPQDWTEYYLGEDYLDVDPVLKASVTTFVPFKWGQVVEQQIMTREEAQVMNESADAGLRSGLVVPVDGIGGYKGVISFAGNEEDLPPMAELELHLVSIYFHHRLRQLLPDRNVVASVADAFTTREAQCLLWMSRGKSDWEIGEILSISERTARAHAQSIKRKVGARTRVQAVVDAIHLGLIEP